jgi:hypothetical protein
MTNKNRRSAAEAPKQPTPDVMPDVMPEEVVKQKVFAYTPSATETPKSSVESLPTETAIAAAVATQSWLMTFTLNDVYAIGITMPNSNMDSHVVLLDMRSGGQLSLADMHVSANMTETDILRGAKRLVGAILNNLARSTSLI